MKEDSTKTKKNQTYVAEIIGEEYKEWNDGNIILVTAPTGSGKSYFILHTFLKQIIEKGGKLLYLVNRKILKKQLEEELREVRTEILCETGKRVNCLQDYIDIDTYQNLENGLRNIDQAMDILSYLANFTYVVCDECHYFYADSNFNTSTELSFFTIFYYLNYKLKIFISATPEEIEKRINALIEDEKQAICYRCLMSVEEIKFPSDKRIKKYNIQSDYSYINFFAFENMENLSDEIKFKLKIEKDKWMIFVDSIDFGKALRKELLDNEEKAVLKEEDVVFLES